MGFWEIFRWKLKTQFIIKISLEKGKYQTNNDVKDQMRATNIYKTHFKMHFTYTYKRKSEPKIQI